MIVPKDGISGQERSKETHCEGDRRARQLIAVWRKDEVFTKPDSCARQKLPAEKVPENRRNMCRLAAFVHSAEFPGQEELETRWQRIDVRGGENTDTPWCEKSSDISQEADGALEVLDDFYGSNEIEGRRAKLT
jgi:hypothetical protein